MNADDPAQTVIGFRPLSESDFPLLYCWLHAAHVLRWFREPLSREEVAAKYLPRVRGESPTRAYLILVDGSPAGYIQTYRVADYPEYAAAVQVEEGAAGVDLFIGEAEYLHRGFGPRILTSFLREVVFVDPRVGCCVIGPEVGNQAAIRAYERAGFRHLKTVQVPGEEAPEYLMRRERVGEDAGPSRGSEIA